MDTDHKRLTIYNYCVIVPEALNSMQFLGKGSPNSPQQIPGLHWYIAPEPCRLLKGGWPILNHQNRSDDTNSKKIKSPSSKTLGPMEVTSKGSIYINMYKHSEET